MGESSDAVLKMLEEGESERGIAQKRIKVEEIMEKDGISALPDCLLLEILSRLPSTKDAVRTGALSTRWEHLWTWVPTLMFSYSDHPQTRCIQNPNSRSYFVLLVDKTLTQCRQLKLKKFEVRAFYDVRFEWQFHNWIRQAISCNVEELNLAFLGMDFEFLLDQVIFINSCFTDLRLKKCKLKPSGAISWGNLRSLFISKVAVDEDLIVNIVSGSPLLETLELEYCYDYNRRLNNITTSDDESDSDITKISAPTSFSLLTQCQQLKLKKFKVYTAYDIPFQLQLNNWIHYAVRCNVKELNLELWDREFENEFMLDQSVFTGSCITELALRGCMLNPVGAISWKNLRTLRIVYRSLDEVLIENILSGSPVLETLVLYNCYGYRRLNITSKSVKNLVLSGYEVPYGEPEDDIIEINAPNIMSLTITNGIYLWKLLLLDVSSLVKAELNYNCRKIHRCETPPKELEKEMLKGHIMNLGHVKELEIGFLCSKTLSWLQAKGFVIPSNVKCTGPTGVC